MIKIFSFQTRIRVPNSPSNYDFRDPRIKVKCLGLSFRTSSSTFLFIPVPSLAEARRERDV